jgi:integrase
MRLLDAATTPGRKIFYALCYTGGLRFGEALSLRWSDINFPLGEIAIHNRKGTEKEPEFLVKDYEQRTIPLPQHTIELLEASEAESSYPALSKRQYDNMVKRWKRRRQNKQPWKAQHILLNARRNFERDIKIAEIVPNPGETLSIHTLRKSCITNWANDLPITVTKELAGHSSIETTMKYYYQVDDYHKAKAAQIIDDLLKKVDV